MNSPYMGKFQVTQVQHSQHDGLDLVGIDSKEIHATVNGTVVYAGWENANDHSQGFGQYICIQGCDGRFYYYGHLSEIKAAITAAASRTPAAMRSISRLSPESRTLSVLTTTAIVPERQLLFSQPRKLLKSH